MENLLFLSTDSKDVDLVLKLLHKISDICVILLQNDADKLYRKLVRLRSGNHSEQRFKRSGFMGLIGRKVDLLDQYEKKLEKIEHNVRSEQLSVLMKVTVVSLIL